MSKDTEQESGPAGIQCQALSSPGTGLLSAALDVSYKITTQLKHPSSQTFPKGTLFRNLPSQTSAFGISGLLLTLLCAPY